MQSLRAEVLDEQQRREERRETRERGGALRAGAGLRRQRGVAVAVAAGEDGGREKRRKDVFSRENRGLREREDRDRELRGDVGEGKELKGKNRPDKVTLALQAKAKIYDQLQSGGGHDGLRDGASACQEVLVDFALKQELQESLPPPLALDSDIVDGYSDIEDEFGRERRVLRSSDEYRVWRQNMIKSSETSSQNHNRNDTEYSTSDPYELQRKRAHEFVSEVRQGIREVSQTNHIGDRGSSGGGVRSQWDEKVLRGREREHLQELHQHTQQMRQVQSARKFATESSIGDDIPGAEGATDKGVHSGNNGSSEPIAGNTAADKRRELLRQKQLAFKKRKLDNTTCS